MAALETLPAGVSLQSLLLSAAPLLPLLLLLAGQEENLLITKRSMIQTKGGKGLLPETEVLEIGSEGPEHGFLTYS